MAMGALGALREVGKGFHGFFLVIILRSWMPYGKVVNSSGFFFFFFKKSSDFKAFFHEFLLFASFHSHCSKIKTKTSLAFQFTLTPARFNKK